MRSVFLRICIAIIGWSAALCFAAGKDDNAIAFKLPVLPDMQRHFYLLENPAYLVLVLENTGMSLSLSNKPLIKGRNSFDIRNLSVRFSGKTGSIYRYTASLKISLAGVATEVTVPAEVDVSALGSGTVSVKAYPPMASAIPSVLLEKVDFKLKLIADLARQREILAYLDGLSQKQSSGPLDARLEAILVEAYNRGTVMIVPSRDVGEGTPLSEQIALIITIIIWLVGLPIVLILRYRRNVRRLRVSTGDAQRQ